MPTPILVFLVIWLALSLAWGLFILDRRLGRDVTPWHWRSGPVVAGCLVQIQRGVYRGNKAMVRGVYARRFLVWGWHDLNVVMTFAELGKPPFDVKTIVRAADVTVLERPRTDTGIVKERTFI